MAGKKPMVIAKELKCTPGLVYNVRSKMNAGPVPKRGRPMRQASGDGMDAIIAAVRSAEQERAAMRRALEQIQSVVADVLG